MCWLWPLPRSSGRDCRRSMRGVLAVAGLDPNPVSNKAAQPGSAAEQPVMALHRQILKFGS